MDIEFLDKNSFTKHIEQKVKERPGLSYFDAILEFCEESDKDPKQIMKFVQPVLLQKIKQSAIDTGVFVPKEEHTIL